MSNNVKNTSSRLYRECTIDDVLEGRKMTLHKIYLTLSNTIYP